MWKEHYLNEEHDKLICPLNRKYVCNGHCAWFDHEAQECKMFSMFWNLRTELQDIKKTIFDGFDALFQKS